MALYTQLDPQGCVVPRLHTQQDQVDAWASDAEHEHMASGRGESQSHGDQIEQSRAVSRYGCGYPRLSGNARAPMAGAAGVYMQLC